MRRTLTLFGLVVLVVVTVPVYYPVFPTRMSLVMSGHPFAWVTPKQNLGLGIFRYVETDSLRSRAIVFSFGRPIGWIFQPLFGMRRYVPFGETPEFGDIPHSRFYDVWAPRVVAEHKTALFSAQAFVLFCWCVVTFRVASRSIAWAYLRLAATKPVEPTGTGRFLYDPLPNQIILLLG